MKFFRGWLFLLLILVLAGCRTGQQIGECTNDSLGEPCPSDMVIAYTGFTAGYSFQAKQSLWVSYVLKKDDLLLPQVARRNLFCRDERVPDAVAPQVYSRSGFDRGHLAPAADMTYSAKTMAESFFMTNIAPQYPRCNRGMWLDVEKQVRLWAHEELLLYVITGPVFTGEARFLGSSGVRIPDGFFKAVLDLTEPHKMIAVVVSNLPDGGEIRYMSVDDLEILTGYDFFDRLDDLVEDRLEAGFDRSDWGL